MKTILKYFFIFLFGAVVYSSMETIFRGFTHWTMFFAGGICFALLYRIFTVKNNLPLWKNCLVGAAVITIVEFIFGCVFNLALGWRVWDYSNYPLHAMGQICLPYTLLWFFLSAPIFWLSHSMKTRLFPGNNQSSGLNQSH